MIRILDKGILFGLGAVLLFQRQEFVIPVVVLLTALIFSSFSLYLTDGKNSWNFVDGISGVVCDPSRIFVFFTIIIV